MPIREMPGMMIPRLSLTIIQIGIILNSIKNPIMEVIILTVFFFMM